MRGLMALSTLIGVAVGGGGAVWFGWAAAHAARPDVSNMLAACGVALVAVVILMIATAAAASARAETLQHLRRPRP